MKDECGECHRTDVKLHPSPYYPPGSKLCEECSLALAREDEMDKKTHGER